MTKLLFSLLVLSFISCSKLPTIALEKAQMKRNPLQIAWVKNLDPVYNTGNFPIGTSSPYIFDDLVYMGDLTGHMRAYDLESGRVVWEANEKHPIQSKVNKLKNNIYYGSKSGRFFARNYLSGKLVYAIDLGAPIESQPIFSKGRAIIHLRNHTIICLDAMTGKVFWRYRRSIPYTTTLQRVSQVMPYGNNLVVGFADGNVVSLSLEEGVLKWEQKISTGVKFIDVDVSPIVFDKYIVVGSASGPMRFLNPRNGVIEKTIEVNQSHTPYIVKDGIYVGGVYGEIYFIDKFAKIKKRKKLSDNGISSIIPYKDGLVVSTMGEEVFYLDLETFEKKDQFMLGSDQSAVFGDLVSSNGYLAVYSSRNRLYVIK